jgi:hypothetical protein
MSRQILGVFLIVLALWGGWQLYKYWGTYKEREGESASGTSTPTAPLTPQQLGELPPKLEQALIAAQREGPAAMKQWLQQHGKSPLLKDPRKAWIELDYVLMISLSHPGEAKRLFHEVKNRIGPDSPVYERVKKLEKTYE